MRDVVVGGMAERVLDGPYATPWLRERRADPEFRRGFTEAFALFYGDAMTLAMAWDERTSCAVTYYVIQFAADQDFDARLRRGLDVVWQTSNSPDATAELRRSNYRDGDVEVTRLALGDRLYWDYVQRGRVVTMTSSTRAGRYVGAAARSKSDGRPMPFAGIDCDLAGFRRCAAMTPAAGVHAVLSQAAAKLPAGVAKGRFVLEANEGERAGEVGVEVTMPAAFLREVLPLLP
jgi:hypothetical protein